MKFENAEPEDAPLALRQDTKPMSRRDFIKSVFVGTVALGLYTVPEPLLRVFAQEGDLDSERMLTSLEEIFKGHNYNKLDQINPNAPLTPMLDTEQIFEDRFLEIPEVVLRAMREEFNTMQNALRDQPGFEDIDRIQVNAFAIINDNIEIPQFVTYSTAKLTQIDSFLGNKFIPLDKFHQLLVENTDDVRELVQECAKHYIVLQVPRAFQDFFPALVGPDNPQIDEVSLSDLRSAFTHELWHVMQHYYQPLELAQGDNGDYFGFVGGEPIAIASDDYSLKVAMKFDEIAELLEKTYSHFHRAKPFTSDEMSYQLLVRAGVKLFLPSVLSRIPHTDKSLHLPHAKLPTAILHQEETTLTVRDEDLHIGTRDERIKAMYDALLEFLQDPILYTREYFPGIVSEPVRSVGVLADGVDGNGALISTNFEEGPYGYSMRTEYDRIVGGS